MLNLMIANNTLNQRIEENFPIWNESTNHDMWKCSFGLYGDRYEDKNRFGYMVDMLTLQAIDSGHLDQAFENVLQVKR